MEKLTNTPSRPRLSSDSMLSSTHSSPLVLGSGLLFVCLSTPVVVQPPPLVHPGAALPTATSVAAAPSSRPSWRGSYQLRGAALPAVSSMGRAPPLVSPVAAPPRSKLGGGDPLLSCLLARRLPAVSPGLGAALPAARSAELNPSSHASQHGASRSKARSRRSKPRCEVGRGEPLLMPPGARAALPAASSVGATPSYGASRSSSSPQQARWRRPLVSCLRRGASPRRGPAWRAVLLPHEFLSEREGFSVDTKRSRG